MKDSADINIQVQRENSNIQRIMWTAKESAEQSEQEAKAMLLALWDADAKQSLRIDLWAQDMTIHDMNDFFFQTLRSMADTYAKATSNQNLKAEMMTFAQEFGEKAAEFEKRMNRGEI